jgi:NAD-reducing hydrogenase small subunit
MSLLDLDERLITLADEIELVYSPFADIKRFPPGVDLTLVEGAVSTREDEEMAHIVRRNSKLVLSFGDCATTGNVTAMRNRATPDEILYRAYVELADGTPTVPSDFVILARLLPQARPLHEVIRVDAFLHGCPPSADQIWFAVSELIQGRIPDLPSAYLRYG